MDYIFQISRWAVVNHGQALKTDQVLARKQSISKNVIVCSILPRSGNCVHRQKPTVFCTISQVLFVLGQNHREWCGRVTFSRGPRAGCTSCRICPNCSESYKTFQNTGLSWNISYVKNGISNTIFAIYICECAVPILPFKSVLIYPVW